MATRHFYSRRCELPVSAEEAFAWHTRPGALERLLPPWETVRIVRRSGGIADGDSTELSVRLGPVCMNWLAEHRDFVAGRQFRDVQLRGPLAFWEHTHRFEPVDAAHSILEDHIDYELPGGPLGRVVAAGHVERRIDRMMAYRHRTTQADLAEHQRFANRPRLRVALTGASGLIGSALAALLTTGGHEVIRLVRRASGDGGTVHWDPSTGAIEGSGLDGVDAVVHLAGENIGTGRWTDVKKERIRESRVGVTHRLCETLARLDRPPHVFVAASAIGFYGDRGNEWLDETSAPGEGFLAQVCTEWEGAVEPARKRGIRVVHARLGVVLTPKGGALARLSPVFQAGMGGRVGTGNQYWSWIGLDDAIGALHHLLWNDIHGPVNLVAPQTVTNRVFTAILGEVLRRPTLAPLPACVARMFLGEMADRLLLASARVRPARLEATGYPFRHPELEMALRHLLGRT